MNHLTHPELFEEHDGLWALSPVKILAAIHAADKGLPCELWDSRCQQLQKFLATEKEHSAYWIQNTKDHQARIRELEAGMREIVALGDCDNSASKMYFVARQFVPSESGAPPIPTSDAKKLRVT